MDEIRHRYLIETAIADFECDDFKLNPSKFITAIVIEEGVVDYFDIYDAITAIHDYGSGITLKKFRRQKNKEVRSQHRAWENFQKQQAESMDTSGQPDVQ